VPNSEASASPITDSGVREPVSEQSAEPVAEPDSDSAPQPQYQRRQSVALTILASLAVFYTLATARAILLPITFGLLFALTLRPLVRGLERRGVSRWVSCGGVIVVVLGLTTAGVLSLIEPAEEWLREAPARLQVVVDKFAGLRERLRDIALFSEQLEVIAESDSPAAETKNPSGVWSRLSQAFQHQPAAGDLRTAAAEPIPVEVQSSPLLANLDALSSVGGAIGTLSITLVLGLFLLWDGDTLVNNLLATMPRWRDKKSTVRLLQNVERGISRYLLTVTIINFGLGVAIAVAMWLMGMPNPALWGLMAALLNYIPYLGAFVGIAVTFLVAVFSFNSLGYAAVVPAVYWALNTIENNFITPPLVGRSVSVNTVAVLLALVVWGWLWGIGGALIAVPLLIVFKLICEQSESTAAISTLLGPRRVPG
jgi:predicted PurR-regulated permease PerM